MNKNSTLSKSITNTINKFGLRALSYRSIGFYSQLTSEELKLFGKNKLEIIESILTIEIDFFNNKIKNLVANKKNALDEIIELSFLLYINRIKFKASIEFELEKYYSQIYKEYKKEINLLETESILKNLERGKKEILYRQDLNSSIISLYIQETINQILNSEIPLNTNINFGDFYELTIFNLIRGMCNIRGIDHLEQRKNFLKNLINE